MTNVKMFYPVLLIFLFFSCNNSSKNITDKQKEKNQKSIPKYISGDAKAILKAVAFQSGGWNDLLNKKDIEYHFEYVTSDGRADISTERYIFSDETSFGYYKRHEVNVLPNQDGDVIQLFDGDKTITSLNNQTITNSTSLKTAEFIRRALYFWAVMPYKLNDPGIISKYLGQENYNSIDYDKIEITYDATVTGKPENDIYILYINPNTQRIDRFYFSLPFFGINAPLIIAEYKYQTIEGQNLATSRNYYLPNAEGKYSETPSLTQTMSNIKFNNGFTKTSIQNISQ